jgi:hypothetical protein
MKGSTQAVLNVGCTLVELSWQLAMPLAGQAVASVSVMATLLQQ